MPQTLKEAASSVSKSSLPEAMTAAKRKSHSRALIVDDEVDLLDLAELALSPLNIEIVKATTLSGAKEKLKKERLDLCLTDLRLPDGSGLDLVALVKKRSPHLPVAVITAYGDMETAVQALKMGAFDFVPKPIDIGVLRNLVQAALKQVQQNRRLDQSSASALEQWLIGQSLAMKRVRQQIAKVARSQVPVFILGETGTGKELVARAIHRLSPRAKAPFIAVNCGAIPKELMESEFFGHKKGAFSGAIADKKGLFEAACGGILFLDEIADLPFELQVKLLRVLQEKKIRPIGGLEEIPIDVRIVSAAARDLQQLVEEGKFRKDLYYRINVVEIRLPPLRERREDIPLLANHILRKLATGYGERGYRLTPRALQQLCDHPFPGNVRELENVLERAVVMSEENEIDVDALMLATPTLEEKNAEPTGSAIDVESLSRGGEKATASLPSSLDDYLAAIERQKILEALERTRWNRTQAARLLGITPRMLRYRMEKLGIV